jgi:hypothetical protein
MLDLSGIMLDLSGIILDLSGQFSWEPVFRLTRLHCIYRQTATLLQDEFWSGKKEFKIDIQSAVYILKHQNHLMYFEEHFFFYI